MIVDEYNDWSEAHQLLVSQGLKQIPGFPQMIRKLVDDTQQMMLNLNVGSPDFNLRYSEMQYRLREYEGIIKILENPDAK